MIKAREKLYRRHTVQFTKCGEDKFVFKRVSFGSKDYSKELKSCLDQTS